MKYICIIALLLGVNLYPMKSIIKKHKTRFQDRSVELDSLHRDSFYEIENNNTMKEFERRKKLDGICPIKRLRRTMRETLTDIELFFHRNSYKLQ